MHFRSWHGDFMIEVDCRLRKDSGKSSRKFYTANRKMTDFERGIYWACWTSSAILLSIALLSRPGDSISVLVGRISLLAQTYPSSLRSFPCQNLFDSIISGCSFVGRVVGVLTVSCPDFLLDLQGFADQDRGVRVGLLHGRVLLGEERAVFQCQRIGCASNGRSARGWRFTGRRRWIPRFGSGGSAAP